MIELRARVVADVHASTPMTYVKESIPLRLE
jgi:hypothetical protein